MSYDTTLTAAQRTALADELDAIEWHGPAGDIRDGLSPDTVLSRLYDLGESESEAVAVIAAYM